MHGRYKLGIIANQSLGTQERIDNWGIGQYFDVVMASAEAGAAKPDLKIFTMALEKAKCEPEEAVMIGDRLDNDIVPAKKLGMKTVWVRQGFARYHGSHNGYIIFLRSHVNYDIMHYGSFNIFMVVMKLEFWRETMEKRKEVLLLAVGYVGALAGCFGVIMFNRYLLMSLPLVARMICMIITYWLIALVPLGIMLFTKEKDERMTLKKDGLGTQILIGLVAGLVISSAYFLVPYLLGFGSIVDNGSRYSQAWQFAYEFFYFIAAVGAVEELVFRGFIYSKLERIFNSEWAAIIISSVLFGLFHILNGNIIQVCITTIIGFIFCIVRHKIKKCTLLSLIILHGVYDFMLTLYSSILFK